MTVGAPYRFPQLPGAGCRRHEVPARGPASRTGRDKRGLEPSNIVSNLTVQIKPPPVRRASSGARCGLHVKEVSGPGRAELRTRRLAGQDLTHKVGAVPASGRQQRLLAPDRQLPSGLESCPRAPAATRATKD